MKKITIPANVVDELKKMAKDLNETPLDNKFFITGFPKSGTRYLWQVLQAAGFNATHESVSRVGLWRTDFDIDVSCYTAVTPAVAGRGKFIHLVRNPVDAINSVMKLYEQQEKDKHMHAECKVFGIIKKPLHLQLCDLWVYINDQLEQRTSTMCRIDVEQDIRDLLVSLGKVCGHEPRITLDLPRNQNKHKLVRPAIKWADLSPECQELAEAYGYAAD